MSGKFNLIQLLKLNLFMAKFTKFVHNTINFEILGVPKFVKTRFLSKFVIRETSNKHSTYNISNFLRK